MKTPLVPKTYVAYSKIFASITTGSVWATGSKDARIMYVTMMALANHTGIVWGTIPGLANVARMTIPEAQEAIRELLTPDPYANEWEPDKSVLREIQGGWLIVSHITFDTAMKNAFVEDKRRQQIKSAVARHRARLGLKLIEQRRRVKEKISVDENQKV